MTRRLSSTRTALTVLAVLLSGLPAVAQVARSQFNGTVSDTAGGVLVGATVVATNVETNVASTATTTDAGIYVIPYLPSGTYRINVTAAGFRPAVANDVSLRAAQTLTIDFQMNVDAITEELTVAAPLIETGTAEIGRYVSNKEYQTWPVPVSDGQRRSGRRLRSCVRARLTWLEPACHNCPTFQRLHATRASRSRASTGAVPLPAASRRRGRSRTACRRRR